MFPSGTTAEGGFGAGPQATDSARSSAPSATNSTPKVDDGGVLHSQPPPVFRVDSVTPADLTLWFTTPPLPGAPGRRVLWVLGDPGLATEAQRRTRDAMLALYPMHSFDALLLNGDNAYNEVSP